MTTMTAPALCVAPTGDDGALCGAPATTERVVAGLVAPLCADCAQEIDGEPVTVEPVEGETALHCHYPRQTSPQPCYVELVCGSRTLSAGYDGEIGPGTPVAVYHRRAIRWTIPCLRGEIATALLHEISPLAARVCAGYSCEWDVANHIGRYTDAATAAIEEITDLLDGRSWDERDTVRVYDAADWLGGIGGRRAQCREIGIEPCTTADQLDEIAALVEADAAAEGIDVLRGVHEHLAYLLEWAVDHD